MQGKFLLSGTVPRNWGINGGELMGRGINGGELGINGVLMGVLMVLMDGVLMD